MTGHNHGAHGHDTHDHGGHAHIEKQVEGASAQAAYTAYMHEGACVLTLDLGLAERATLPMRRIVDALVSSATRLSEAGAIIGHIKVSVSGEDAACSASITDAAAGPRYDGDPATVIRAADDLSIVAIVLAIDLQAALDIFVEDTRGLVG